ncbi:MAG: hypothetical protein LBV36_00675 [Chromatiales bacterium]|jgi:cytoskeletal protein CcmA (bactofilin family)|nr:hypothetical protein [Chromatiales bacterium]
MKRILALSLLFVLALSGNSAGALGLQSHVFMHGEVDEDLYLIGRSIRVDAHAAGDVVVAGGQVQIEREVDGDVLVAGGQVDISAQVHDDVRAVGGQVRLAGNIDGDAVVAGGFVRLLPGTQVGGRAWLAGRNIKIDGDIAGRAHIAASTVTISGHITSDVIVRAKSLHLLPTARIEGNLTHQGPEPPQVEPGAVITGELNHEAVQHPLISMHGLNEPELGAASESALQGTVGDGAAGMMDEAPSVTYWPSIMLVLMLLTAAFLYHVIFPRFSLAASSNIGTRLWATLGLGIAILLLLPPLSLMLMATAIGAPIGIVAMLLYPTLLLFGFVTGMMFIAQLLLLIIGRRSERARWLLIALIPAFALLWLCYRFVPSAAGFTSLLLATLGTGAIALQTTRARNTTQGARIVAIAAPPNSTTDDRIP